MLRHSKTVVNMKTFYKLPKKATDRSGEEALGELEVSKIKGNPSCALRRISYGKEVVMFMVQSHGSQVLTLEKKCSLMLLFIKFYLHLVKVAIVQEVEYVQTRKTAFVKKMTLKQGGINTSIDPSSAHYI